MTDAPGAGVADLVAVMDRLRSPGGCPWDAEQTHESLLKYLLEECYETVDAVESGDRAHLREELGDLLLQVVFHARIAQEHPADPFDLDDVATGIANKLRNRHPHVFAGLVVNGTAELEANWEAMKVAEKGRTSALDGVPAAQPALALAAKLLARARRAAVGPAVAPAALAEDADLGAALFAVVAAAAERGLDPEAELRRAAREFATAVRADEAEKDLPRR